jgi:hypothetical protein
MLRSCNASLLLSVHHHNNTRTHTHTHLRLHVVHDGLQPRLLAQLLQQLASRLHLRACDTQPQP